MMLLIGSDKLVNSLLSLPCWQAGIVHRKKQKNLSTSDYRLSTKQGFTLIEVMVTTVVLSLGIVLIYKALFVSLDVSNYCNNYLRVTSRVDEKVWQAQDILSRLGHLACLGNQGSFTIKNKEFNWRLSSRLINQLPDLYKINFFLYWEEGRRSISLSRTAYAIYYEER